MLDLLLQHLFADLAAFPKHSGQVETAFEDVAFLRCGNRAVAVQVSVPVAVLAVGEVRERPVVNLFVHVGVLVVAGKLVRQQRRDNRFVVVPPEFHVVPVLDRRFVEHVAEIEHAAVLFVPAALPHPVENVEPGLDVVLTVSPFSFVHDKPGAFDGVSRVERSPFAGIDDVAVGRNGFHDAADVRLHEVLLNLLDALVNLRVGAFQLN